MVEVARIGEADFLRNIPRLQHVTRGASATHKRGKAGEGIHMCQTRGIFTPVNRLQLNAFRRAGKHPFIKRSLFELGLDELAPVFKADRGEFRQQVTGGCLWSL
jgi:hypothetical protein